MVIVSRRRIPAMEDRPGSSIPRIPRRQNASRSNSSMLASWCPQLNIRCWARDGRLAARIGSVCEFAPIDSISMRKALTYRDRPIDAEGRSRSAGNRLIPRSIQTFSTAVESMSTRSRFRPALSGDAAEETVVSSSGVMPRYAAADEPWADIAPTLWGPRSTAADTVPESSPASL
jgi:hypothetical protein